MLFVTAAAVCLFPSKMLTFFYQTAYGNDYIFRKGGKGGVGIAELVEVEQLRLLIVVMMGREQVGVTEFYFYIRVLICINNKHQYC